MKKIKFNFENVGGLAEVYAFPPSDFLRLRHDYVNDSDSLELRMRDNVIAVPVYGDRSFVFSEEKDRADGGDYWDVSIEGVIPNINKENRRLVEWITTGWFICQERQTFHYPSPQGKHLVMLILRSTA